MKKLLIIILLLVPTNLFAADWNSWDEENTALHIPLTILYVADLGQTLWAHDNIWGKGYREGNDLLGHNPSKDEIWGYFIGSYALTTWVVWKLPPKYSHALQGAVINLEINVVNHNYTVGVGIKF
jgi:hypothetical protein